MAALFSLRNEIGQLSLADKLPAICQFREMVDAGFLASYGISISSAVSGETRAARWA
jgi:hypothetical protein